MPRGQTDFQRADQAAFDSRFTPSGSFDTHVFEPYSSTRRQLKDFPKASDYNADGSALKPPAPAPPLPGAAAPQNVIAAKQPEASVVAPVPKAGTDVLSGIPPAYAPSASLDANARPSFGGQPLNADLTSARPALRIDPSAAQVAGANLRDRVASAASGVVNAVHDAASGVANNVVNGVAAVARPIEQNVIDPAVTAGRGMLARAAQTATAGRDFIAGATGAPGAGGDAVASGVSRSRAARIEKPTKANPRPKTPTTPTPLIDSTRESIARFGQSEDDWQNQKLAFAGF